MDEKLLLLINREWTNPALDRLMAAVTCFDVWFWPMLLLILFLVKGGGFTGRAFVLTAALSVAINDGVVSNALKHLIARPRPHQVLPGVRQLDLAKARPRLLALFQPVEVKLSAPHEEPVSGRSFPSAHTMNNFSIALVCATFYRRRGWLAFVPATLVGYSRIYTGAHWPSDVITSVFIGLGLSMLLLALFEWLWSTQGARWLPRLHAAHPSLFAR